MRRPATTLARIHLFSFGGNAHMADLPAGTVTFLFSDIEGSTRLWEADPGGMKLALARHDEVAARAVDEHGGHLFKHTGDGMCAAFSSADAAVAAAVGTQLALGREQWPDQLRIRVRMGIHTGPAEPVGDDYFGASLNRCARVMSCAHGGQTLCTAATREMLSLIESRDPGVAVALRDLGTHRLRDLSEPQRLYQVVHRDLEQDFPPLRTLDAYRNNLPTPRTSFIGRNDELAELIAALGEQRLVTVTGAGGSGKTRLALQAAAEMVATRPDGVFFVELAALSDPSGIVAQIADTIGLSAPGVAPAPAVEQFFGSRRSLLVLDNCEHLLEASAVLCDGLLSAAPDLAVLVTSREPLGVPGELVVRIPSLGLPAEPTSASAVAQSEAGQLFIDRTRAVQPQFRMTEENAVAVAGICRRLDGIPLAIELAAARVRHLSPQQIAERLDDRFRLLTGGARTALPRQQTLKAALDWSFDLLNEEERTLLLRLSVFVGSFPLSAVEAVCSEDSGVGMDGPTVLDVLGRLVDRSVVVARPGSDQTEYRLLETVRHYAQERLLATGEVIELRNRHRSWYANLASGSFPPKSNFLFRGDHVSEHYDNLLAALQWSVATESGAEAVLLTGYLCQSWLASWRHQEAEHWLALVLGASWVPDCPERFFLASLHASFAALNGDFALSLERSDKAIQEATSRGYRGALTVLMWSRAIATSVVRSIEEAVALLDEAARLALELGEAGIAVGALCASATYRLGYDLDQAVADAEAALAIPGVEGEARIAALITLALAHVLAGDTSKATALLGPAMLRHVPSNEVVVPGLARGSGENEFFVPFAVVLAASGDLPRAKAVVAAGRQRLADVAFPLVDTAYLVASGASEIYGGDAALGMRLLGAARRRFGEEGAWRSPVVGCLYVRASARAREILGAEAASEARLAGMALDREEAAALAE